MPISKFPPVSQCDEDGLLAVGGDLHPESLILAYKSGIFPWPISKEYPLAWFSPDPRGVLDVKDLHYSKRLKRYVKKLNLTFKFNHNFKTIIQNCADVKRRDQAGTWITSDIVAAYELLFHMGYAYCLGAYDQTNKLVAGIYGTCMGSNISGESMFTLINNGSKLCFIYLIKALELADITWIDTQMVTPVIESLGGKEISRELFLSRLNSGHKTHRSHIFIEHDKLITL